MKNISHWAKKNPWKSRGILVILHLAILFNTIYLARLLFEQDYSPSPLWRIPLLIVIILSIALYPFPSLQKKTNKNHYLQQKFFDFLLTAASTVFFVIHLLAIAQQPVVPAVNAGTFTARTIALHEPTKDRQAGIFKELRTQIRDSFRESRQLYRSAKQEGTVNLVGSIALIILIITVAFILSVLVAALSCNLSCSGNESLAIVVLLGGWAWILVLSIFAIRAILRKYNKHKESIVPENPVE